jgi:hypothetical protein
MRGEGKMNAMNEANQKEEQDLHIEEPEERL